MGAELIAFFIIGIAVMMSMRAVHVLVGDLFVGRNPDFGYVQTKT